nr:L-lactate dehydrogenase [Actinomyces sp.]
MSESIIPNTAQGSYPTAPGGRPSKVAIIGAGAVGSTLAYACVTKGVAREVVLQDIVKEKVEAEALDIAQGIQFTSAGAVSGSDDPEICRDADVIAITAGAKQKPGQSRLELAGATVGIMEKILPTLVEVAPNAIFVLVANPVDVVTYCAKKITGLPENQVFGSGTVLDTARMRYLVSLETGTATQNIHGYIAGEHGDSEVPLWSSTQIGGVPITQWGRTVDGGYFDQAKRDRIAHDVVRSAYRIIEGKGATNYAVGLAVQRIISAVLNDEQRVLTISPLLDNWHGISDVCMAVPTIVGRDGAGRRLELPLTLDERDRLTASAERLRDVARGLGY